MILLKNKLIDLCLGRTFKLKILWTSLLVCKEEGREKGGKFDVFIFVKLKSSSLTSTSQMRPRWESVNPLFRLKSPERPLRHRDNSLSLKDFYRWYSTTRYSPPSVRSLNVRRTSTTGSPETPMAGSLIPPETDRLT